jgi:hypothetical protein
VLKAAEKFLAHVVPSVVKPIRVLWNEVVGFIFICFAVLGGFSTWRNFRGGQAAGNPMILLLGGGFCLMLLWYGLSSFRRAKKISRS